MSNAADSRQSEAAKPAQRDLVQVPLYEIQRIRDAIQSFPETQTNTLLHQLHAQICVLYENLHKQLKGRAP